MDSLTWPEIYNGLLWPLVRLIFFISVGLFAGILIETLNWTRHVAVLAAPLARLGRLKDIAAASFSMAFFSGFTANSMLAEAYDKGQINDRELLFSNLFNSFPTFFLHLPSLYGMILGYFSASPYAGWAYVGLSAFAALLRTGGIVLVGHFVLPPLPEGCVPCRLDEAAENRKNEHPLARAWKRFRKRLPKIAYVTIPIFTLIFLAKHWGVFQWLQQTMGDNMGVFDFLPPEAISIIAVYLLGEIHGGLSTAAALLTAGVLQPHQVVLALLIANFLSSPMRAFRHQFPYYAGIFKPGMAARLIAWNQTLRALSIGLVAVGYYLLVMPE
ncbi:hypothetical protein [Salidesulfovibrio onnuriiensis]|uniref:hypothetical protein n=1 Tax=Salidesulfovibrio onnuriiensis TaxID=2583823 RepID=UPI0011C7A050|nr:hypothetical protein [Salidesulfovibrio onnuriiensis]